MTELAVSASGYHVVGFLVGVTVDVALCVCAWRMLVGASWARTTLLVVALVVAAGALLHLALFNQVQPKLSSLGIVDQLIMLFLYATAAVALSASTRAGYFRNRSGVSYVPTS